MCQRIQPWPKNITHCSVTIVFMQTNPITNCVFWPLEAPSLDLYDSLYDCTLNMRCFDHQRQDATCAHGRFNNVSCVQISIVYDDSFVNLQGNWFGWSSSPRVWNSSTMTSCPLCTPSCQSTLLESTCTWRLSPVSTHAQTHTHTWQRFKRLSRQIDKFYIKSQSWFPDLEHDPKRRQHIWVMYYELLWHTLHTDCV